MKRWAFSHAHLPAHGDHRRQAALDEPAGEAAEGVVGGGRAAVAGDQGDEPQLADAQEDLRQQLLAHELGPALLVLQHQGGAAAPVLAMAEEMEEVEAAVRHQAFAQPSQRGRWLQELATSTASASMPKGASRRCTTSSRRISASRYFCDVGRRGDDAQQAGPPGGRRPRRPPHAQVAGESGVGRAGQGQVAAGVGQQLPVEGMDPSGRSGARCRRKRRRLFSRSAARTASRNPSRSSLPAGKTAS